MVSPLVEYEVYKPTSTNVITQLSAVVQDRLAAAASLLKRIGHDGHRGEVIVLVHLACDCYHGRSSPTRVDDHRLEGIADDVADQVAQQFLIEEGKAAP